MNTGIGDAMNLGWKLAGAVHGWAPPWLLDSYETERYPVGAMVLKMTDVFNKMMVGHSRPRRALTQFAIRTVLRRRQLRTMIGGRLTGLGIAYRPRQRGEHRWSGRRMPELETFDGPLYDLLRDGRFVLVAATGMAGVDSIGTRWSDRVRTVQVRPDAVEGLPAVVLVRPDGYVAWASDAPMDVDVVEAIQSWCGPAAFARRAG